MQIYEKYQDLYTVEPNNARQLVEIAARDIEKLLSNRSKALVVSLSWICSFCYFPLLIYFSYFIFSSMLPLPWKQCRGNVFLKGERSQFHSGTQNNQRICDD